MTRNLVNTICATFPGGEVSDPWGGGHDAWKVGGKMFACVGTMDQGVSVKTPDIETAEMLIAAGVGEKAAYFHRSWVFLRWENADEAELKARLEIAYRVIRDKLPKKTQAGLFSSKGT